MSRTFWVVVGAVGGVFAYRKGTQAASRARELGPLGSAQVAAQATSRLAGRTAHGLGRLQDVKARREGKLLNGATEEIESAPIPDIPEGWVPTPGSAAQVNAQPSAESRARSTSSTKTGSSTKTSSSTRDLGR